VTAWISFGPEVNLNQGIINVRFKWF
jgi:hypothetical protein